MNIAVELAHYTLELIADINQKNPSASVQETAPETHVGPVETLATLDYGGWMTRLMEEDDWRETEERL